MRLIDADALPRHGDRGGLVHWKDIEDAPTIEPPHWIPVSERLPDKNCRCLCTNDAWGAYEVDWNAWINGEWLYPNEKPIAWMPLPEPYEEGNNE